MHVSQGIIGTEAIPVLDFEHQAVVMKQLLASELDDGREMSVLAKDGIESEFSRNTKITYAESEYANTIRTVNDTSLSRTF